MSSLRNQLIDRIDVLNKVKELFLVPNLEMIPMRKVADFYEVDISTIRQVYLRNKEEVKSDGVKKISLHDLRLTRQVVESHDKFIHKYYISLSNGDTCQIGTSNFFFSPRAVLRIGMLLRDSEVAKEVRTQLLNTSLCRTNTHQIAAKIV